MLFAKRIIATLLGSGAFVFALFPVQGASPGVHPDVTPPFLVGDAVSVEAGEIVCTLTATPESCRVGDTPGLRVTIVNLSNQTVFLPGSLDGSYRRGRYPLAYFAATGPEQGFVERDWLCCGFMNPMRLKDLVRLAPGEGFDPYETLDSGGFFRPWPFDETTFDKPGEYRIDFYYSTNEPDPKEWVLVDTYVHRLDNLPVSVSLDIVAALRQVPLVDVTCSTVISVSKE